MTEPEVGHPRGPVDEHVDLLAVVRGPLERVIGKPATDAVYNLRAQRDALETEVERLRSVLASVHYVTTDPDVSYIGTVDRIQRMTAEFGRRPSDGE